MPSSFAPPHADTDSPARFYVLHVEDNPGQVQFLKERCSKVLTEYGLEKSELVWWEVPSLEEARDAMAFAEKTRPGRGFDAVFIDLEIQEGPGQKTPRTHYGMEVLKLRNGYPWIGATVCVSSYANHDNELRQKENELAGVRMDDWLVKSDCEKESLLLAKLRRCLVPVELFLRDLDEADPPVIVVNPRMKRLVRELVLLARRPYRGWPLCRLLLLGDAGAGKGALSRAFHLILSGEGPSSRPFVRLNCASAVSEGHGGRIALFGARGFGNQVADQPGVFERASQYPSRLVEKGKEKAKARLAEDGERPLAEQAGVVFLDEFAELAPNLQASILNALEEGEVRREGDGSVVGIGCHVVFATNLPTAELVGQSGGAKGRVRHDLLDRIPNILHVPSLAERRDEVEHIIRRLASARLDTLDDGGRPAVDITPAARKLIDRAILKGWLNGVRQLQSIADVLAGETRITDANLRTLFTRVNILTGEDLRDVVVADEGDSATQAAELDLPAALRTNDLPEATAWCVWQLYQAFVSGEKVRLSGLDFGNSKAKEVGVALLTELLSEKKLDAVLDDNQSNVRQWRNRHLKKFQVERAKTNPNTAEVEARRKWVIGTLLKPD